MHVIAQQVKLDLVLTTPSEGMSDIEKQTHAHILGEDACMDS